MLSSTSSHTTAQLYSLAIHTSQKMLGYDFAILQFGDFSKLVYFRYLQAVQYLKTHHAKRNALA